jgi:hypothetical protein
MDNYPDPEGFLAQVGVVFEEYPEEVIKRVTDPRTGPQRRLKWPPTISEIVEECDRVLAHQETIARYAAMGSDRAVAHDG